MGPTMASELVVIEDEGGKWPDESPLYFEGETLHFREASIYQPTQKQLRAVADWLNLHAAAIRDREKRAGFEAGWTNKSGERWTFDNATDQPVARAQSGPHRIQPFQLVPISPRKPFHCRACSREREGPAWRKAPGNWVSWVTAKTRFCDTCVQAGQRIKPLRLASLDGEGAAAVAGLAPFGGRLF